MASPAAFTPSITINLSGTRSLNTAMKFSGNAEDGRIISVAAGAANLENDIAIYHSNMQCLVLLATGANLTVKTNSSGAPTDTISLIKDIPTLFVTGGPYTNPLSADVTKLFISNAAAVNAQLDVYVCMQN